MIVDSFLIQYDGGFRRRLEFANNNTDKQLALPNGCPYTLTILSISVHPTTVVGIHGMSLGEMIRHAQIEFRCQVRS